MEPASWGIARQSGRVILIVLDGVAPRVAYDSTVMPFLVELSRRGIRGVSRAPEETNTPAGVRALATGANTNPTDMLDMFSVSEFKGWTVFDDIVKRILAGEAPPNLLELLRKYFSLTPETWGKDLQRGGYAWIQRAGLGGDLGRETTT